MKILIIVGHPEVESLNFCLRNRAVESLERAGHEVRVSDLVQEGFSPTLQRSDFPGLPSQEPLRIMEAQKQAQTTGQVPQDIKAEQEKLQWCDLLVVQFPVWWGGYPAVLKGWFDRVLAHGFAYGKGSSLSSKSVLYSATVGSDNPLELDQERNHVRELASAVFGYMGWEVLDPIVTLGAGRLPSTVRAESLDRLEAELHERVGAIGLTAPAVR